MSTSIVGGMLRRMENRAPAATATATTAASGPLRADARRNQERVLAGARLAFAASGFDVSYHEVARLAGVGVGTVYRRYPDRDALFEALLVDVLEELAGKAEAACAAEGRWASFGCFFRELSSYAARHAGLSGQLGGRDGPRVAAARQRLLGAIDALCEHTRPAGLRDDFGRHEFLFLAHAASAQGCGLDLEIDDGHRNRAADIILDGMRKPSADPAAG